MIVKLCLQEQNFGQTRHILDYKAAFGSTPLCHLFDVTKTPQENKKTWFLWLTQLEPFDKLFHVTLVVYMIYRLVTLDL